MAEFSSLSLQPDLRCSLALPLWFSLIQFIISFPSHPNFRSSLTTADQTHSLRVPLLFLHGTHHGVELDTYCGFKSHPLPAPQDSALCGCHTSTRTLVLQLSTWHMESFHHAGCVTDRASHCLIPHSTKS